MQTMQKINSMSSKSRTKRAASGVVVVVLVALTWTACQSPRLGTTSCPKSRWWTDEGRMQPAYRAAWKDAFEPNEHGYPTQNKIIFERLNELEDDVCSALPPYLDL